MERRILPLVVSRIETLHTEYKVTSLKHNIQSIHKEYQPRTPTPIMPCQLIESREALCYIWTTIALLLIAVVCFGIGSVYEGFVYVGITLTLIACLCGLMYMIRGKSYRNKTSLCMKIMCCRQAGGDLSISISHINIFYLN